MRVFKPLFILPLSLFLLSALNSSAMAAATETKAKAPAKIDLNSATEEQLKELPGVGDVFAKKIVSNRPYKSVSELSKAGLSENQIAKISPHATVKRSAMKSAIDRRKEAADKRKEAATAKRSGTRPTETSAAPKAAPSRSSAAEKPAATARKESSSEPSNGTTSPAAGSSDRVWLNTDSNVYHRSGDYWYGKTKSGKFVTEEEAKAAGAHESMH
jgi:hypothetical protein